MGESVNEAWKEIEMDMAMLGTPLTPRQRKQARTNRELPATMTCDNCYGKHVCRNFKAGSFCTVDFTFTMDEVKDFDESVAAALRDLIRVQYSRIKRFQHFEMLGGGNPDEGIPDELLVFLRLFDRLRKLEGKDLEAKSRGRKGRPRLVPGGTPSPKQAEGGGVFERLLRSEKET